VELLHGLPHVVLVQQVRARRTLRRVGILEFFFFAVDAFAFFLAGPIIAVLVALDAQGKRGEIKVGRVGEAAERERRELLAERVDELRGVSEGARDRLARLDNLRGNG